MNRAEDSPKSRNRGLRRALLAVGLVVLAGAAVLALPVRQYLLEMVKWTRGLGGWGLLCYVFLYAAATVLFLPGSILTLGAGFAFGLLRGTAAVMAGSLLGVSAAFLLGRTLVRDWVEGKVAAHERFRNIDEAVAREGFKIVLLTRLSPAFPFNLLNYAFGVTRVSFRHYFLASWVGMFPGTVLYVYLGSLVKDLADLDGAELGSAPGGPLRYVLLA